jgi:2'-5' RNA ligase
LFVAVWPPDDVLDRVAALGRPVVAGLRWTTRDQWHVTLRFLGQVPEADPVVAAMAGLTGSPAAERVAVPVAVAGPAVDRFGQRILQVPVAGLGPLAGDVVRATAHLGRPPDARPFAGHLTLARASKGAAVDLRPLTGAAVAGQWTVDEVCLVESRLTATGAQYSVIERFRLAAADR